MLWYAEWIWSIPSTVDHHLAQWKRVPTMRVVSWSQDSGVSVSSSFNWFQQLWASCIVKLVTKMSWPRRRLWIAFEIVLGDVHSRNVIAYRMNRSFFFFNLQMTRSTKCAFFGWTHHTADWHQIQSRVACLCTLLMTSRYIFKNIPRTFNVKLYTGGIKIRIRPKKLFIRHNMLCYG